MISIVVASSAGLAAASAEAAPTASAYEQGVKLRQAGQPALAVPFLEAATRAAPADADAWLNLGLAYSAVGRLEDADRALNAALSLSPDYLDVQLAQARVGYFRNDLVEAQHRLDSILLRAPSNAEALALKVEIARARSAFSRPWRLDVSIARAQPAGGGDSRRDATVFIGRTFRGDRYVTGGLERIRQFGATDNYLQAQAGARAGYLTLGGTANAHFRPRWSLGGGLFGPVWSLGRGWSAQLAADTSFARYPVGNVRSVQPSLTLAHSGLSLSARWHNTWDETDRYRTGYALRGAWRPIGPLEMSLGYAAAPESTEGRTIAVRAVVAGLAVDVLSVTTLRVNLSRERRAAYDLDQVTLGLTQRF